jgi:hypothetical protein
MKNQKHQLARPGQAASNSLMAWPADWGRLSNRSGRPDQAEKKRPVGSSGQEPAGKLRKNHRFRQNSSGNRWKTEAVL